MDNSRQAKCSSPWQSLTPPVAAPSQIQPQQPRNQHLNACSYPHVMQEVNSASRGMIQEVTTCSTSPNLFPNHSGYAGSGSLYPEILSGYPSFQKNDLQRFPIPKPFSSSSKSPVSSSSYIVRPAGFEGSHAPTERVSQNIGTQKMKVKADPRRVIPSLEVPTCSHSSGYSLLDVLQAANFNRQSSECARPVIYRPDTGRGKVKEVSGLADGWLPSTRSSGEKFHSASIQPLQKAPPLAYFSLSHPLSAHTSGCPRVFCLRTSGDLMLSNTGLLGVQCLCHGLYMSISKFSEHSGSYGVNPGYAVRVDSGETIAQWRKIYFQKFGIRVPEDQDGWDWPEGFSAADGTVKYSSMASHLSRNSDLPTEFVQPSNNETFLKSSCKGQKCSDSVSSVGKEMNAQNGCGFSKGFIGASQSDMATVFNSHFTVGRQMNAQNGCGFLSKGLIGASQRNFPTLSSNQIMKMPVGGCPTTSNFAAGLGGPVSGCHPISDGLDSMCKSQHPCISRDLPNPNTSLKVSDLRRLYNMKEGNIGDKDASSSSFELRLGQPSSPSQTSGSVCPALRSHQLETRGDLLKSLPPRPMILNSNSKVLEERLQHAGDCPVSNSKTIQSRWNIGNNANVVNHARSAAKLEPLKGDVDRSLILSMLLSQYRTPVDTIDSRTTSCLVSGHNVTTSKLLCESRFVKHDPENSHVGMAITTESEQNIRKLNPGKYSEKMKGIGRVSGGLCVATEPNKDFHPKHLDTSTNSGGLGKASSISSIEANDHSSHQQQFSGRLPDECSDINSLKHSDKVPSLGVKRSMGPLSSRGAAVTLGPGAVLPMQGVSMGCVATTISVPNTAPTLSMKDNKCKPPNPLDENSKQFRVLAFRDIIELFNQRQTNTSLGVEKDLGRLHEGSVACSSSSKEQDVTNVAAIILQPGLACYTGGTGESISPPTPDLDRRCNNSSFSPEKTLYDKSLGAKFPLSHEHQPAEPPPERYVRTENDISSVNKHRKGFQNLHFQGKSDCNALSDSCSKIRNSEVRAGSLGCTTSKFIDPKSNEKTPIEKVQVISFHEIGNLEREVKKKVDNQAFQWKDVPSKQTRPQCLTFKDQPCNVSDRGENSVERIADAASKCSDRAAQDVVSSGCSAPAITQASVFSNNIDTTTLDTGDKFAQSRVLDEESGIDECWSSDNLTNSERSSEFCSVTCKTDPTNEGSSKMSLNCVSRSLIDELRLRDSLMLNKVRKTSHTGLSVDERRSQALTCYGDPKTGKRKRPMKCKLLNASSPGSASDESGKYIPRYCSSTKGLLGLHSAKRRSNTSSCSLRPGLKPRSVLCSTEHLSCEIETDRLYGKRDWENDKVQSDADSDVSDTPNDSCKKKLKLDKTAPAMKPILKLASICADDVVNAKVDSPDHMITSSDHVATCGKVGPVVCGEYGVISNGNSFKPVKISPLTKVLKAARRCTAADNDQRKSFSLEKVIKRSSIERSGRIDKFSNPKRKNSAAKEFNSDGSLKETQNACFPARRKPDIFPHTYEKETNDGKEKDHESPASCVGTQLKPKCKEVRKRGLYELVVEGKGSSYGYVSAAKASIDLPQRKCKYLSEIYKADDDTLKKSCTASAKSTKAHNGQCSTVDGGALCCVCGSSDDDQMNCLLECGQCLVRVHQACYGVPILPKGQWYCRPCLTNSRDIVCVLCGYGGGAMTRALRSQNIVKGLLKAWNVIIESDPRDKVCQSQEFKGRIGMSNSSSAIVTEMEIQKQSDCMKSGSSSCKLEIHNSITAGVHDANVKQWIHIVCGLWTPGTRCPDVNTMSAFDVYGASSPNPHGVCSICNRSGGTCIQCRVEGCSEQFHPWCGHQKYPNHRVKVTRLQKKKSKGEDSERTEGLLQSEVEGLNNESIGFYGRCQLHATYHQGDPNTDPAAVETGIRGEKECTSARTEGYKGRKRDGLLRNDPCQFNSSGRCAVSQEHLNAWLHINRLISRRKGCPELPVSDVEHDHRKEYARYKQSKGWKKLVVYKSGIHALGLYTSQFIDCGALVVEYIGEVVGLRVADKRENEYESGRKFQSKSACYFFRIDKEHIIDATCKGGIARFVNHSCQPNCIAKVISVKNEKKVVFFAERDIYPGEEITYDYHFNNEDERKKIPCLCKSNNCRRYLN